MASPNVWTNVLGPVGPSFAIVGGHYLTGNIRWVDSSSGNDANTGLLPGSPKKTWSSAYTASSANDSIVLLPGFTETITGAVAMATGNVCTVGLGAGAQMPTITTAVAGTALSFNAANIRFFNVAFAAGGVATGVKIASTSTAAIIDGCVFTANTNDLQCIKVTAGSNLQVSNCSFTAQSGSTPTNAILGQTSTNVVVRDCSFDGGSAGWLGYAVDFTTNAPTGLDVRNVPLYNKSGFRISVTGSTYHIFGLRAEDSTPCPIVITS
jgi:hypothetical protein